MSGHPKNQPLPEKCVPRNLYFFLRRYAHQHNFRCPVPPTKNRELMLTEYAKALERRAECIYYEIDGLTGKIIKVS